MWMPEDIGIESLHIGGDSDTMVWTGQFSCCVRAQQKKVDGVCVVAERNCIHCVKVRNDGTSSD